MDLIAYPYMRIITPENLAKIGLPKRLIEYTLNERAFSFYYQVGFPQNNIRVMGNKDEPIGGLLKRLDNSIITRRIEEVDKITVVRRSLEYKEMFKPCGIELGDIEELDDEDYRIFVKGINRLMSKQ